MAEENKSSLTDIAEKSANAAHTIHGAVKTGKAIAAAAKGTAVGGPYGAAAGLLIGSDKQIGKFVIAFSVFMMLPILIVAMLPAIIFSTIGGFFGGLFGDDSDASAAVSIMNDYTAIIDNIRTINTSLELIVLEGINDVHIRIDTDFAVSTADRMEVSSLYEDVRVIDITLIISMFCAAYSTDIGRITLAELERIIRANIGELFTFTKREAVYEYTVTDPETKEEAGVSETVAYYTVIYNGNTHLADTVFFLTDVQKTLAADYSSNLRLFLSGIT
jgi:hypothetical protein